ncbi:lysophospholipase [Sphingomonas sp. Leaf33]|uniref:alpha/beta fold hydrolase n=1 Tax=Sphingomonas sp. Leaf33 TaxID=1736215 RepID=UPI0006F5C7C1|nr:alpha/beta hydrolase [Sphingomonas sp. Leaf33]KQN25635.1 lysophospholipase [Sphingomonas sp. Leaf33]
MSDFHDASGERRRYPADATITRWLAPDGWPLRVFDWPAGGGVAPRGSILFQGGRGDFIEKYLESFAPWHARGWRVTAFDWRGQGGSGRTTPAPHVGHIADFADFIGDLRAFWAAWSATAPGPLIAMGHSMGGHLVLRALAERAIDPQAVVLVAPMLGLRAPISARVGEAVAGLMTRLGDPARAAWKGNERPHTLKSRQSLLTHDDARYCDELWWQAQDASLLTGPPSWTWVAQGFASTRRLNASPALADVRTPVLMLVAEADGLVDPRVALAVAARLPDARVVRFGSESAHEILREVDSVRGRALTEIDAFLDARAQDTP